MTNGVGVGVIVLSKDRPDLFERCARSLANQVSWSKYDEKILIQNGTDSETIQLAMQYGWAIFNEGKNLSFSEGCNLAVNRSNCENILLLNNDAILREDTIAELYKCMGKAEIVGSLIVDSNGLVNHAGHLFLSNLYTEHYGRGLPPEIFDEDILNLPSVTFACAMIARSLWDKLGGLDEEYIYGWEDLDFCLRAKEINARIMVAHRAVCIHDEKGTRDDASDHYNIPIFQKKWIMTNRIRRALGFFR